jgi:hypothetical protein
MGDVEKCSEFECLARESLLEAWREIQPGLQEKREKRSRPSQVNYTQAADYLHQAEEAFGKGNFGESLKCTVLGRDAAAKARVSAGWWTLGLAFAILCILLFYFVGAVGSLFVLEPSNKVSIGGTVAATVPITTTTVTATPAPAVTIVPTESLSTATSTGPRSRWVLRLGELFQRRLGQLFAALFHGESLRISGVDLRILVWGFLGGVVWCMYGLSRWYSRRIFDWHYLFYYILNPWIALALGGVFSLTILSGLVTLATERGDQTGALALLYLVSFTVGLATHKFLKLLIRIIAALFGQIAPEDKSTKGSKDS